MKATVTTSTNRTLKKLLATAAMGAFIAVPLLGEVLISEAQGPGWGNRAQYQTFTGTVTSDPNNDGFDIRVGNTTYNVFTSSRISAGINKGDTVRVYGERSGTNDIRNANATIIGRANAGGAYNRPNNNQYQTVTGTVTNVVSNQRFELRVGNATANVYTAGRLPQNLNRGDEVRVYGVRTGSNEIRNANVTVIRRAKGGGAYNRPNNNGYRTVTGTVTNVVSNQRFELRVGNNTANVYTAGRLPQNLNRGDEVRVYGVRTDSNEMRNANVTVIRRANTGWGNQPGNRPGYQPGNRPGQYQTGQAQTFTGQVTDVDSDDRFNIRVGNTTYNVYTAARLPRRLNEGDVVRVYGIRSGNNDIRNANVVIVNNQGGNQAPRANQAATLNGTVIAVQANNRFTFRSGGIVYTVHTGGNLPRNLRQGDAVRVFGLRAGNQIRNAAVAITNNR